MPTYQALEGLAQQYLLWELAAGMNQSRRAQGPSHEAVTL